MASFKKFNYIVNEKNGHRFPCTDFYLYPVTANDYADFYKNYYFGKYPVMAFIYLTNKCPDNCNGCFARAIEDSDAELDLPVIERTVKDLAENGTKAVKVAGREPTASPHLSKFLELTYKYGLKSIVISSGACLHLHEEALTNYCTHLRLSLNTVNQELHESLHHPSEIALKFNERIEVASRIVSNRNKLGLITGATYLIRNQGDPTAYEYAVMCKKMGFSYVRFTVLDHCQYEHNDSIEALYAKLWSLEDDNFKVTIHKQINEPDIQIKNTELIDPAILSRVVIHGNGKVNSCHEGWRGKWETPGMATFGNINEISFNEIWNGQKRKDFLNHIKATHEQGMKENGSCVSGNKVCSHNCKYNAFNTLQKWIISELENDPESSFLPALFEKEWDE